MSTLQSVPEKYTKFNAPPFCNCLQRNHVVFTIMHRKDRCQSVNAKFISMVQYSLIKQPELDTCCERFTLRVNITPLTVEDRLLIKTLQTGKGWIVEKNNC